MKMIGKFTLRTMPYGIVVSAPGLVQKVSFTTAMEIEKAETPMAVYLAVDRELKTAIEDARRARKLFRAAVRRGKLLVNTHTKT